MFWAAQSTIEETFKAYTDVCLGPKRAPEPVTENEKTVRRPSTTETRRSEKATAMTTPATTANPRVTRSYIVGKSNNVNK